MKKFYGNSSMAYSNPSMTIKKFGMEDVITTSGIDNGVEYTGDTASLTDTNAVYEVSAKNIKFEF